jgi:hypothetical protein
MGVIITFGNRVVWRIDAPHQKKSLAEDKYFYEQVHFYVPEFNFRNEVIKLCRGQCYKFKWTADNLDLIMPCPFFK